MWQAMLGKMAMSKMGGKGGGGGASSAVVQMPQRPAHAQGGLPSGGEMPGAPSMGAAPTGGSMQPPAGGWAPVVAQLMQQYRMRRGFGGPSTTPSGIEMGGNFTPAPGAMSAGPRNFSPVNARPWQDPNFEVTP